MYPVYQLMDSYPNQTNQMPSSVPYHRHHHHPRFEAVPAQMKTDFERCPPYYQCCPSGGTYGYPFPAQCHSCCEHNFFPGYYILRPPYVHAPPPNYCGSYPVPPGAYPVSYIPPPNYTMEPPRYKYHSEMPGYGHCCGCPNHTCNSTPGKNVKIEEEDHESETKADDSLVPIDLKNYPYPVVWIPPGYIMNKADSKPNESQPEEKQKYIDAAGAHGRSKHSEQQQDILNRWFPFDMDHSRLTKQGDDSTRKQQHQDENNRQVSFPLFWMPWSPDEIKRKDNSKTKFGEESVQGTLSGLEGTPVPVPDTEEKKSATNINEEINNREHLKTEKNSPQKTVQGKSAEPTEKRSTLENIEEQVKRSIAENVTSNGERMSIQTSTKSKSPSLPKTSKLPPICLRVDPLQKKKNSNGGLRSPSPPGGIGKLHEPSKDSVQPPTSRPEKEIADRDTKREFVPEKTKDVEQSRRKLKSIKVIDGSSRQEETENSNITDSCGTSLPVNSGDVYLARQTTDKSEEVLPDRAASEVNLKSSEVGKNDQATAVDSICYNMNEHKENSKVHESPAGETKEFAKTMLSEAEAALVIQSAYRGYKVRRWEPLKKLKQIANISEEVVKLNNQIQALESCSDTQDNDKRRTVLGETIMNLLLKLDTVQGLHPSIRDVRKSVARRLVSLQDKLDHLSLKNSENADEPGLGTKPDQDMQVIDNPRFEGAGEDKNAMMESDPSKSEKAHVVYPEEYSQGVASIEMDNASNFSSLEIPETIRSEEDLSDGSQELVTDIMGVNTTERSQTGFLPETGARDEEVNLACNGGQGMNHPLVEGATSPVMNEVANLDHLEEFSNGVFDLDAKLQRSDTGLLQETEARDAIANLAFNGSEEMIHPLVEGTAFPGIDEASNLNQPEDFPNGLPHSDTELQNNDLLLFEAEEDKALQGAVKENDEHVQELAQLQQEVPDNDVESSGEDVIVEQKDDKVSKDGVTTEDISAEVYDGEVLTDQEEQESLVKVPVISESNETLACHKKVNNNMELSKEEEEEDFGLHEISVQAQDEDESCISKLGDDPQMHNKVVSVTERQGFPTTPAEAIEVYKAEEQVLRELAFTESETENMSREENGVSDPKNSSSCEDAVGVSEECDASTGLNESQNVENDQKLPDQTIEMVEDNMGGMDCVQLDSTEAAGELPPSSPTGSQISLASNASTEHERKLVEENERLREMMQKLIEAGKEQLTAISNLSGRVKDLEKKLSRKKKLKMRRHGSTRYTSGQSCLKPSNDPLNEKPLPLV